MSTLTALRATTATTATTAPPAPDQVVERLLRAIATQRIDDLAGLLSPDVWLRALLTRHVHESTDAAGAMRAFQEWFGSAEELRVVEVEQASVRGREHVRYRFLLRPAWAPERWHEISQAGFCRVRDGRITRIDLACTGFHPLDDPPTSTTS